MKASRFTVTGLTNATKAADVKQSISARDGISSVKVDVQSNAVTVDYDEAKYSETDIKSFISQTGLSVTQTSQ